MDTTNEEQIAERDRRIAGLEAALAFPTTTRCGGLNHTLGTTHTVGDCVSAGCDCDCSGRAWNARQDALSGGTAALDAVVAKAVAAERARLSALARAGGAL